MKRYLVLFLLVSSLCASISCTQADVNDNSNDMDYKRLKNGSIKGGVLKDIFIDRDWEIKE